MAKEESKVEEQVEETPVAEETQETAEQAEATEETVKEEVKSELQIALERIAALEAENADLKDQVLRRAADFDNYRKRAIQDKQEAIEYANTSLLKDLLDSLDNFDRTVEAANTASDAASIAQGVTMVNKSLVNMLETKYNLVSYGKVGDEFNPDLHEAIGMQEGDVKTEELSAVYLKGYKLKERVIRHAKVMVCKPKA